MVAAPSRGDGERTRLAGRPALHLRDLLRGAANRVAYAAARAVAETPTGRPTPYNPLYLNAGVGRGKTHLLHAITQAARAADPGRKVVYLTAEHFMFRFVAALKSQQAIPFKEGLREIDLLLIDDLQFLQGKSVQQEFCHMLNALIDGARQVVVAADRPAADLETLDERVRSRLRGGVAFEIDAPDLELRRQIVKSRYRAAKAQNAGVDIPETVIEYVAQSVVSNGRDLEGALNRLVAQWQFTNQPVTMASAEVTLRDLIGAREPRRVKIEDIQKVVAVHFNVSKADLLSSRRTRTIVRPRQIAMYLSKTLTPRSLRRDRAPVRRPRPHHGAACRAQGRGADARRSRARRRGRAAQAHDRRIGDRRDRMDAPPHCFAAAHSLFRRDAPSRASALLPLTAEPATFVGPWGVAQPPFSVPRPFAAHCQGTRVSMRAILERSNLLKSLNHVHRVVERRNTIPILSNVLIQAAGSTLTLKATDLDLEVLETVPAEIGRAGATTVPAHMLYDIVRKLPDGAEVALETAPRRPGPSWCARAARGFSLQMLPETRFPGFDHRPVRRPLRAAGGEPEVADRQHAVRDLHRGDALLPERHLPAHALGRGAGRCCAPSPPTAIASRGREIAAAGGRRGHAGHHRAAQDGRRDPEAARRRRCSETRRSRSPMPRSASPSAASSLTSKLIDGTFPDYQRVIPAGQRQGAQGRSRCLLGMPSTASRPSPPSGGRAVKLSLGEVAA